MGKSEWRVAIRYKCVAELWEYHYIDVIMSAIASQITIVSIVYSTVCSGVDWRKHHSSASLAFVREIHRWSVNSPHKGPVTRKMLTFDDVIMIRASFHYELRVRTSFNFYCVSELTHLPWRRMYASANGVNIGLDNGLFRLWLWWHRKRLTE